MVEQPTTPLTINSKTAAALVGYGERYWRQLTTEAKNPAPLKVGGWPRWSVQELRDWLAAGAPNRAEWETIKAGKQLINK